MWLVYTIVGTLAWSAKNVIDSLLVRKYGASPIVMAWCMGSVKLLMLIVLFFYIDTDTTWKLPLFLLGIPFYVGSLTYFYIAKRIDASVMNSAWAIQSIFLALIGFHFSGPGCPRGRPSVNTNQTKTPVAAVTRV